MPTNYRYCNPVFSLLPSGADDWDCTTFALPDGTTPFLNGMRLFGIQFFSSAADDILHLRHGGQGTTYPPIWRVRDADGSCPTLSLPGNLYKIYLEGNRCVFGITSQARITFHLS